MQRVGKIDVRRDFAALRRRRKESNQQRSLPRRPRPDQLADAPAQQAAVEQVVDDGELARETAQRLDDGATAMNAGR